MIRPFTYLLLWGFCLGSAQAQSPCHPAAPPGHLEAEYLEGEGLRLSWEARPGTRAVQVLLQGPDGSSQGYRVVASEPAALLIPDGMDAPGTYIWRVQLACSDVPPFDLSPVSAADTFSRFSDVVCPEWVRDPEGHAYPVVVIGSRCWMAKNLRTTRYRNGDSIARVLDNEDWMDLVSGAYCPPAGDTAMGPAWGLLYNWYATADNRGICPAGWRIPDQYDWLDLSEALGRAALAGGAIKTTGTLADGTGLWLGLNEAASNSSGFSGLPAGYRSERGFYFNQGYSAGWWTRRESNFFAGWTREVDTSNGRLYRVSNYKKSGFSVRCVRNPSP